MNTSNDQARQRSPRHRHWARRSHRIVAIGAFAFLLLITVTGLILNHADELGLPREYVAGALAKRLYGIEAAPVDAAFEAAGFVFVTVADAVYANAMLVADNAGKIRGAVALDGMITIATERELILTTIDVELVERSVIEAEKQLSAIGLDESRIVVEMNDGQYLFSANQMNLVALDIAPAGTNWSAPIQLSAGQLARIDDVTMARVISRERLLSDLHSGRILPGVGRYIVDLAGLCLLYLALSGVLLWFRKR